MTDLQNELNTYLELRQSLGGISESEQQTLQKFAIEWSNKSKSTIVRSEFVIEWVRGDGSRKPATQAGLLSLLRGFLRYLKTCRPETEIPDHHLLENWRRPHPYIFTDSEIIRLLRNAAKLEEHHSEGDYRGLRHHTYETLLGLLACTGLRVSEAQNLLVSDVLVQDKPARLLVRDSKFGKSRWVPVHATCAERLRDYAKSRNISSHDLNQTFFVSHDGSRLKYSIIYWTFQKLLMSSGIGSDAKLRRPCIHSLRHSFAVHRIRDWFASGQDARSLTPHLSVYMGHVCISDTYWYLTASPELLGSAAQLFENYFAQGVIK